MAVDLTDAVIVALRGAGERILTPERDLARRAIDRHRARRRVRRMAATGLVVVALVATGMVVRYSQRTDGVRAAATATLADAKPVTDVWPYAVRRLPLTLPDGAAYEVAAEIGPGTYIVQASSPPDTGTVYRFTPTTGVATELVAAPPHGSLAVPMLVNGSDVAVATRAQPARATDVYLVSAVTGQQIERVTVPAGSPAPEIFGWIDGHLDWSPVGPGVYADTDPAQLVPGTADYRLTGQGAWTAAGGHGNPSVSWWNLDTDERHTVTARALGTWSCSYGDYCLYTTTGTAAPVPVTYSGFGPPGPGLSTVWGPPLQQRDHFALLTAPSTGGTEATDVLWDLATASCGIIPQPAGPSTVTDNGTNGDFIDLPDTNGQKVVLDLDAITK